MSDPYAWHDGRYRYCCENGHHVHSRDPHLATCPAPLRVSPDIQPDEPRCGGDMEYREVPMTPARALPSAAAGDQPERTE